jgi:CheY-like chemotaxis protein
MLDLVAQATIRGAELTHRLLAFARRQPLAPQSVDVSRHVGDLIPLLKRTLGEAIEVASNLKTGLHAGQVDPGQLEGALLNLAINARDAMPDGGVLGLETSPVEVDAEFAGSHGTIEPGTYVVVTVSDTGMGIAPENLKRMFDPFFTTKAVGQGSGLGLAMVWAFARQSGGHVSVYSELGHGTTVRLYLPIVAEEADLDTASLERPAPEVRGTGHVLVVEDDELVRRFAAERLIARGYSVTAVGSGPEALRALDTIGHVDLLFSDIVLPGGMTGRQLAEQFLVLRPGTPVLYTSGYGERVLMHDGQPDPGAVLLPKPYSSRHLTDAVQKALAASPLPPSG